MSFIITNEFLPKEKKKNGQIEGTQSLNNKRLYVFVYDKNIGDFVGKWIDMPSFVKSSYKWQGESQ